MFTGIIPYTGTIVRIQNTSRGRFIIIQADPKMVRKVPEGGSVSVDGVCLTRLNFASQNLSGQARKSLLTFELMASTLKRTTLSARRVGDHVNIEPAMLVGQPIGGHFISGHVDGVGVVRKVASRWHTRYLVIDVARALHHYLVPQGSIVVNGVSLTVVEVRPPLNLPLAKGEKEGVGTFSVALTSYTLKHTNLGDLRVGDKVNIEVDMLAKYLEKFFAQYALRHRSRKL